jgi:hypothetical protein
MGTGGPFPGGKSAAPSSAEVKNEQKLYLLSPQAPPWRVAGLLYFYFSYFNVCLYLSLKLLSSTLINELNELNIYGEQRGTFFLTTKETKKF